MVSQVPLCLFFPKQAYQTDLITINDLGVFRKYKDILGNERVGSLLALISANSKAYDVTSEAFMLLETVDPSYEELAFKFFGALGPFELAQCTARAEKNTTKPVRDVEGVESDYDEASG